MTHNSHYKMEEDCSSSSKQEDSERASTAIAVTNEEVYMVYKKLLEKAKLEKRKVSVKELNSFIIYLSFLNCD